MKYLFLILITPLLSYSQDRGNPITISGFAEVYYGYEDKQSYPYEKEDFIYNNKRINTPSINLALIKADYGDSMYRASIGLMKGDYAHYNLKNEPLLVQHIYEAHAGFLLSKENDIWIDAGILPSHIGFEGAISSDSWTLTRSILSENSPFYFSGIKITGKNTANTFTASMLLVNGWQNVALPQHGLIPALGLQIQYKPNDILLLNYSNYIGDAKQEINNSFRTYHNVYTVIKPFTSFQCLAGFDLGSDKKTNAETLYWYSPVIILQYALQQDIRLALRAEYFDDYHQAILTTNTPHGFEVQSYSFNIDYMVQDHLQTRLEGKYYHSRDRIFHNYEFQESLTMNLAYSF